MKFLDTSAVMEKSSQRGNKNKSMTQEQRDYAAFEEKVKRTVYLDNLSPQVTVPILNTALGQFGKVLDAQVLPNYLDTKSAPICALVEMQNEREAKNTVAEITVNAFMIAGAPRPVRAKLAKAEMFPDRPPLPGRRIQCYWIDPSDPDWEAALRWKNLVNKHIFEAAYLQTVSVVFIDIFLCSIELCCMQCL